MTIQFVAAVQMTRHDMVADLNGKFTCSYKNKEEQIGKYENCMLNSVTISETNAS